MPPKPPVKQLVKKGLPTAIAKPPTVKPSILAKKIETPTRPLPLKTGVERPVLRAFECLVNVELAQHAMRGVGIFVGPDAEKQRTLQEQITQDLIQLQLSYKTYWKQVDIESKSKADFKGN